MTTLTEPTLAELRQTLELRKRQVAVEEQVVVSLAERGKRALTKAELAKEYAAACEQASALMAQFADDRQARVLQAVQDIASTGLTQVFGEPIELVIEQVVRARRVELDIKVKTGTLETPVLEARGGGLAAVTGFLLRAAVLLLTPGARKLLVLDEVFAQLSADYLPRMADFLTELCHTTGLQVLLVTHSPEFAESADAVYRIEKVATNTSRLVKEK